MATAYRWHKLNPTEFKQLQDYTSCTCVPELTSYCMPFSDASKPIATVLSEIGYTVGDDATLNAEDFRHLLDIYLDAPVPDELVDHLFLSFIKRPHNDEHEGSIEINTVALCFMLQQQRQQAPVVAGQRRCAAPSPSISLPQLRCAPIVSHSHTM